MGMGKRVLLIFFAIIFLFAVMLAGIVFTVASSLEYNNLKSGLTPLLNNFLGTSLGLGPSLDSIYVLMNNYCQTNSQYVFSYGNYTITFPCSVISQGKDSIINYAAGELIKGIYYKDYNCNFIDCFQQGGVPTFLISEHTRNYLLNKFYVLLVIAFASLILMFITAERKANALILSGIFTLISALPLLKLNALSFLFPKGVNEIINVFFSTSQGVFTKMMITGGVLLALGILFRLFGIAEKITEFISQRKEEEPKPGRNPRKTSKGK